MVFISNDKLLRAASGHGYIDHFFTFTFLNFLFLFVFIITLSLGILAAPQFSFSCYTRKVKNLWV